MKIVYIGTVEFSLKLLERIIDIGGEVVGVCTKENSNYNSDYADLTPLCRKHEIPYKFVSDINDSESVTWIRELKPDVIFCFGWSSLIKKELLRLSDLGVVGFHPSLLPLNRGRHPIVWALVLGLEKTGSTFFIMDEGADSGDILSQKEIEVTIEDNASSLYRKIITSALIQVEEFLPRLSDGTFLSKKQDHRLANTWRKRYEPDGRIDFRMSSRALYNLVRALTKPYVGAHIEYHNERITVWKCLEIQYDLNHLEPGKVLDVNEDGILIKTGDAAILIVDHEFKVVPKIGEYL